VTPRILLRSFSIAEAVTWALLLTGMALKAADVTPLLVTVAGSIHGAVFIAYCFVAGLVGVNGRWPKRFFALAWIAAVPPFATLLSDWWIERRRRATGAADADAAWSLDASTRIRRFVAGVVQSPVAMSCAFVALVSVILANALARA